MNRLILSALAATALASPVALSPVASAEPAVTQLGQRAPGRLLDRLRERRTQQDAPVDLEQILPGARKETFSYGPSSLQTYDVYTPPRATNAPVLVMVHGGAWKIGDKDASAVVDNKLRHWLPQGFIVVSVNYRLLPEAMAFEQAQDVARAIQSISDQAPAWGGDRGSIILMGHSAGAHIAALLASQPDYVQRPLAGAVILDSAVLDVDTVMGRRHPGFYDEAFGSDPAYWRQASPADQWSPRATPMMVVCSSRRPDDPCDEARDFARMTSASGVRTPVLPVDLSHRDVNETLGQDSAYTRAVDAFISARLRRS